MFPTGQIPVQQQAVMLPVQITEEDIKQLKEMFPNVEDEVIKSVLEEKQGHKQAAINALLSINDSSWDLLFVPQSSSVKSGHPSWVFAISY